MATERRFNHERHEGTENTEEERRKQREEGRKAWGQKKSARMSQECVTPELKKEPSADCDGLESLGDWRDPACYCTCRFMI